MPLVVYALGAYVVGLYAGFATSPILAVAAIGAALAIGWTRGRVAAGGLVALAIAGIAIARSVSHAEEACVKGALAGDSLRVVVADSIAPGGFTRGRVEGCEAS